MRNVKKIAGLGVLLAMALVLSLVPLGGMEQVSASPSLMLWYIVDTPRSDNTTNVIADPATGSEINVIAIGSDGMTFYAVDIPNSKVHKSIDGGITWTVELNAYLTADGANLPVWNLAVAPDDLNFLVAITDGTSAGTPGPREVYISEDGGTNWERAMTGLTLAAGEYISCVDISVPYSGSRHDIAIGTRVGDGTGRVWVLQGGFGTTGWVAQDTLGWFGGDVTALKFSPTYPSDMTLMAVSSVATGTYLRLGIRDTVANTTNWDNVMGYPVELRDVSFAPTNSPDETEIITADIELPSDFSGQNAALRRVYVSTDAVASAQSGIYRIDNNMIYRISPPTTSPTDGRISSIAYFGNYAEGVLLAGEVTAGALEPSSNGVYIWRTSNASTSTAPTWLSSDTRRSPTGGASSGFANAQVVWSPDGGRAYCGTSSASPTAGGTVFGDITRWPSAWTVALPLDESAFSISPYTLEYGQLLSSFGKASDPVTGHVWNQISLVDTQLSFLSDVAALEAPEVGEGNFEDYDILYLASVNAGSYDGIWRSTSIPLGRTWERVLCIDTSDVGSILRIKQTAYDETDRSDAVAFADRGADVVGYSGNEGQVWDVRSLTTVTDLALAEDDVMYILSDTDVYRYEGPNWVQTDRVGTQLDSGHTIAVPLKNPGSDEEGTADWVIVGEAGMPNGRGRVAYADFSESLVRFGPAISELVEPPVPGDAHVIADDRFEGNKIIYNAVSDSAGVSGKIYRWVIDSSTVWDELEPPNGAFYGVVQRNDVLYGAWATPEVPEILAYSAGADRTLYPRVYVPPPPEWDYMTEGLDTNVVFTREPSSLKISSNEYASLWAIDNRAYDWTTKVGCLWSYTDIVAKVGPWTTSPASGDYIPVDPVSGRALEVNFVWRQLSYSAAYELQIAKDSDFTIVVLRNQNIIPVNPLDPECYFPAGGLVPVPSAQSGIADFGSLEAGHTYYWRVRARTTTTGEYVRSPWSATMYFTVGLGLPVVSPYPTINLSSPAYGARDISRSPNFSWSPMPRTTKYEFVLAKDADLKQVVTKTTVPETSYLYGGKLDFDTTYFWQVRALDPIVSSPSAVGSFTVLAEEKPVETTPEKPAPIPYWVWGVIGVITALVASMIAFATVKPGYVRPRAASTKRFEVSDKPKSAALSNLGSIFSRRKSASLDRLDTAVDRPKAAPAIKMEPVGGKPKPAIFTRLGSIFSRRKAASLDRLDVSVEQPRPMPSIEPEPVVDKPPGLMSKIWADMLMRAKRLLFWRKPGGGSSLDDLG